MICWGTKCPQNENSFTLFLTYSRPIEDDISICRGTTNPPTENCSNSFSPHPFVTVLVGVGYLGVGAVGQVVAGEVVVETHKRQALLVHIAVPPFTLYCSLKDCKH